MLDTSIGPIHYGAANDQEIDTAWQSDTGAWQYKMVLAGYNAHARNVLNAGDIIEYSHPASGQTVTFQPLGLNWVDNVTNSRQQLALPQAVEATVDDDTLIWTNGYGTGRHFSWQTQTARLLKVLTIDSAANLPAPTVQNPYLEIEFIVKYSDGLTIVIDGQTWNKRDRKTTANSIEFKDGSGNILWYFRHPLAWDSGERKAQSSGLMQVERRGNTQYVTVRWPKAWVDAAVFPIYLDTTIDETVTTTSDDGYVWTGDGNEYTTDATSYVGSNGSGDSNYAGMRFQTVNGDGTVSSAYITLRAGASIGTAQYLTIYCENVDDAATWGSSHKPWNGASGVTPTTATVAWNPATWSSGTDYNSPDITTVIQEIWDRAGWAANNDLAVLWWPTSTAGTNYRAFVDYSSSSTNCARLHIEYSTSTGATGTLTATLAAATSSAAGTVQVSGALSKTLASATSSATGTVQARGASAINLAAATVAATGTVRATGSLSATLADATLSAAGTVSNAAANGAADITLANATSAATGTVQVTGAASITLGAATSAAAGTVAIDGDANITLADATLSATATGALTGAANITLANATVNATGTVQVRGAANITLANATVTGAGAVAIDGDAAITLVDATVGATGTVASPGTATGTAIITLADATSAATGTVAIAGAVSITLDNATVSGVGTVAIKGALTATLANATVSGAGTVADVLSLGTAIITLADATASATGTVAIAGIGSITLADATSLAVGSVYIYGTGAVTLAAATLSGTGTVSDTPTGPGTRDVLYLTAPDSLILGARATLYLPTRKELTVDN